MSTPTITAEVPMPAHGGSVIMAGAHPVEVVAQESGEVHAYLIDEPAPDEVELLVEVPTREGKRPVTLEWHRGRRRWEGRVRNVTIVPGPIDVHVEVSGESWRGHGPELVIVPAAVIEAPPRPRRARRPQVVVEVEQPRAPEVRIRTRGKHRKHRKRRKHRRRGGVEIRFR